MPITDPTDIRLNEQYEIQELMGDPPGWILRYGMLVVAGIVLALVAAAYFVRFPDLLAAPGVITSAQPPVRIAARTGGDIERVLVADRDTVAAGQLLVLIDNAAGAESVRALETWLDARGAEAPDEWIGAPLPTGGQLGELQPAYSAFSQNLRDWRYFLRRDKTARRIANLRDQVAEIEALNRSRSRQEAILREELRLARSNVTRDSLLVREGARSERELESARATLLDGRRRLENLRATVYQNNIRMQELQRQMLDLRQQRGDVASAKERTVREDFERLRSALATWKTRYRIVAPAAGRVALPAPLPPGRFVREGEELLTLLPLQSQHLLARAALPLAGAGKVRAGMRANIRLADYPYQEFGTLRGEVSQLALLPQDNSYLVTIALPDSLVTTYGYVLPFRQEMQGRVTIVTENRRLLVRLFDRLWSLVRNPRG